MLRTDRTTLAWMLAILALALGVRFTYWAQIAGTPLDEWHRFDQSDMATYLAQAKQFSAGDWLAREPVHPYHTWQRVAPPLRWLEWYGPHAFHQAPGYSYALAVLSKLVADPIAAAKALQLALGAVTAVLAFLLARELGGRIAGACAGVLVAVYAPLFHLEAQVLREGPVLCFEFALLYALAREVRIDRRAGAKRFVVCAAFGAALGLFHVFHELGAVLLAVTALALALHHGRTRLRDGVFAALAVAIGYAIGFAPLAARNVEVGAAPFAVSCRTQINFAIANEAEAADGGASFDLPGPSLVAILDGAHGSFPAVVRGVWATYDGDVGRALHNWIQRAAAICEAFEVPDNTSFDFYRTQVRLLRVAPDFALLFPLGFAGLCTVAAGAWRYRGGARDGLAAQFARNPRGHAALALFLFAVAGSLSFVHVVGRFRLYVTPAFFVGAGIAVAALWDALRARRVSTIVLLAGSAALAVLLQLAIAKYGAVRQRYRGIDFYEAATFSREHGRTEDALRYADQCAFEYAHDFGIYMSLGSDLERARQWVYAIACYRAVLDQLPDTVEAKLGIERATAAMQRAK